MNKLIKAVEELEMLAASPENSTSFERYSGDNWRAVHSCLPEYYPAWYRCLTTEFLIGGASVYYPIDIERQYIGLCTILRPKTILDWLQKEWPLKELFNYGYSCFGDGENGDLWLFRKDAPLDPEVFFLELTGWNGMQPTVQNGLIAPRISLSTLLSSRQQASF